LFYDWRVRVCAVVHPRQVLVRRWRIMQHHAQPVSTVSVSVSSLGQFVMPVATICHRQSVTSFDGTKSSHATATCTRNTLFAYTPRLYVRTDARTEQKSRLAYS